MSFAGKKHTLEFKKFIGETNRGRHRTPEEKRKISEARKGKPRTEEDKQKIRAGHLLHIWLKDYGVRPKPLTKKDKRVR